MEKLKITEIMHRGVPAEELVVLQVTMDCNLSDFMLVDAEVREHDEMVGTVRNCFWFPDVYAKSGDFVLVHTAAGESAAGGNQAGSRTHVYYWGKDRPVWTEPKKYAILVAIQEVFLKELE